ncbi:hypothetical protein GCK32_015981 [Trichostrongylus colubriformis]|uniref:Phorbol-ester/DAG-type domain-containing protein n=1 Tax=Trichostrongylus colubriformis TaxID=6319 RepID=A0AAN8INP6_TRICO
MRGGTLALVSLVFDRFVPSVLCCYTAKHPYFRIPKSVKFTSSNVFKEQDKRPPPPNFPVDIAMSLEDVNDTSQTEALRQQQLQQRSLRHGKIHETGFDRADHSAEHDFCERSYHRPTFCDHCGSMLFGLLKQGLQCSSCKMNVHKRCKWNVAKDCGINTDDVPAVSAYLDVASGVPNVSVRFIEEAGHTDGLRHRQPGASAVSAY